jgi:diguanylate cyclase (GGDEF)-like protein/PAS domain S-box-containing protein
MPRDLLAVLPVGLIITDRHGLIRAANPGAERAIGVEPGTLVGRTLAEVAPWADSGTAAGAHEVSPGRVECALGGRGGPGGEPRRRVSFEIVALPDDDGEPGFVAEVRDVTAQVESESSLRQFEHLLRDALDSSLDAFILLAGTGTDDGLQFHVLDLNRRGQEWFGVDRQSALGLGVSRLLPPELAAAVQPVLEHVYQTGEPADRELDVGRGGAILIVHLEVVATAAGLAVMCRDTTEASLRERRSQREERIANAIFERSPTGIQVFDAQGDSERANEAQRELLGLGHQDDGSAPFNILRDPLAFATGEAGAFARAYRGEVITDFEYDVDLGAPSNVWSTRRDQASFARTVFPLRAEDGSITAVVSFLREITERKRLERRLEFLAFHDPLTELANRGLFATHLAQALRTRRPGYVAVAFADLDDFKRVNDHWGHAAGDALLCHVAAALRVNLRGGDLAARLGGDEFGILLDDVPSAATVRHVLGRIEAELARPVRVGGVEIRASASVGVVLAARGTDPEAVIRAADRCMYKAKTAGKGQISQRVHPLHPPAAPGPATPRTERARRSKTTAA